MFKSYNVLRGVLIFIEILKTNIQILVDVLRQYCYTKEVVRENNTYQQQETGELQVAKNKGKKQKIGSMKTAEYRKFVKSYGWRYSYSDGDHDYYDHPTLPNHITVVVGKTYGGSLIKSNIHQLETGYKRPRQ